MEAARQRCRPRPFADLRSEFKRIENEFVAHEAGQEDLVLETKRRVAEALLEAAVDRDEPFETCQSCWDCLLDLGFTNLERACFMAWTYASCCLQYQRIELGLQALEPVVTKVENELAQPALTKDAEEYYQRELTYLRKLLNKLKALQK